MHLFEFRFVNSQSCFDSKRSQKKQQKHIFCDDFQNDSLSICFFATAFSVNQAKKLKYFDFTVFPLGTKNVCALAIFLHTDVVGCPYLVTFIVVI